MPGRRLIPLACPHAGQAVGSFGLPSCRAHAFMRVGTPTFVTRRKGGKGVPKGEENRSERFSEGNLLPFLLWNPSSFDRSRFASVAEAPGACRHDCVKRIPATMGEFQFKTSAPREPRCAIENISAINMARTADLPPAARRPVERIYKYERIH